MAERDKSILSGMPIFDAWSRIQLNAGGERYEGVLERFVESRVGRTTDINTLYLRDRDTNVPLPVELNRQMCPLARVMRANERNVAGDNDDWRSCSIRILPGTLTRHPRYN